MGAIKLSNAVKAAQTKGEEGRRVLGRKGVVGIAKKEEKGMIWAPHMGFGTGTNSKKCYIERNVENRASQSHSLQTLLKNH